MKTGTYIIISFLVLVAGLLVPNTYAAIAGFVFLAQLVLSSIFLRELLLRNNLKFCFSPCVLSFFYVCLNYITGSFVFHNGLTYDLFLLSTVCGISDLNLKIIHTFVFASNTILCIIAKTNFQSYILHEASCPLELNSKSENHISLRLFVNICLLVLFLFLLKHVEISFSSLGGSGDLSFPLVIGLVVVIAWLLISAKVKILYRLVCYLVVLVIVFATSFSSKREAMFIFLSILMIESLNQADYSRKTLSLKRMFVLAGVTALLVITILASSIMRGYGNFEPQTYVEAISYIPQYADNEKFVESFINNLEAGIVYGSSVIAGDYYIRGVIPTLYGESFFRVLFIPFPESVIGYKPRKFLHIYTSLYDYSFRSEGGSYPVIVYNEFMSNFGVFGIVFLSLFFSFIEKMYYRLLNRWNKPGRSISKLTAIVGFSILLQFTRGSGLDSLIIYVILSSCMIIIATIITDYHSHIQHTRNKSGLK